MTLFEHLKEMIPGMTAEREEQDRRVPEQMGAAHAAVREATAQRTVEEIEQVFAAMRHEPRINFVTRAAISRQKWRKFYCYVSSDLAEKWGLDKAYIKTPENETKRCLIHEAIAEPRVLRDHQRHSESHMQSQSEELSGEVGSNVKVLQGKVKGAEMQTDATTDTTGSTVGDRKTVWECATLDKDCKLNRRSFIKVGEYHMTCGETFGDQLQDTFERVAAEVIDGPTDEQAEGGSEEEIDS